MGSVLLALFMQLAAGVFGQTFCVYGREGDVAEQMQNVCNVEALALHNAMPGTALPAGIFGTTSAVMLPPDAGRIIVLEVSRGAVRREEEAVARRCSYRASLHASLALSPPPDSHHSTRMADTWNLTCFAHMSKEKLVHVDRKFLSFHAILPDFPTSDPNFPHQSSSTSSLDSSHSLD